MNVILINKHERVRIEVVPHLVDTQIHVGPKRPFALLIIFGVLVYLHLFTKLEKRYISVCIKDYNQVSF